MFENARTLETGSKANRATRAAIVVGDSVGQLRMVPTQVLRKRRPPTASASFNFKFLHKRQRHGHDPFTGKIKAAQSLPSLLNNSTSHGFQKEWLPKLRGDYASAC